MRDPREYIRSNINYCWSCLNTIYKEKWQLLFFLRDNIFSRKCWFSKKKKIKGIIGGRYSEHVWYWVSINVNEDHLTSIWKRMSRGWKNIICDRVILSISIRDEISLMTLVIINYYLLKIHFEKVKKYFTLIFYFLFFIVDG